MNATVPESTRLPLADWFLDPNGYSGVGASVSHALGAWKALTGAMLETGRAVFGSGFRTDLSRDACLARAMAAPAVMETTRAWEYVRDNLVLAHGACAALHDELEPIAAQHGDKVTGQMLESESHLMTSIACDAASLLGSWLPNSPVANKYAPVDAHSRSVSEPLELAQSARTAFFGVPSVRAFRDPHPATATLILRHAIEVRTQRIYGTTGFTSVRTGRAVPVKFTATFWRPVWEHRAAIGSTVDLALVRRAYKWSNEYTHSGDRDWAWLTWHALRALWPFLVHSESVWLDRSTLDTIRAQAEATVREPVYPAFHDRLVRAKVK